MNTIKANSRILNNLEGESTVSQNEQLLKRKTKLFPKGKLSIKSLARIQLCLNETINSISKNL